MRPELHKIERIERFLNAELNGVELTEFENELIRSSELQQLVADQQLIQQAAMRKAIRADVLKYGAAGSQGWGSWGSWSNLSTWTILNWLSFVGGLILLCGLFVGLNTWIDGEGDSVENSESKYNSNNSLVTNLETDLIKDVNLLNDTIKPTHHAGNEESRSKESDAVLNLSKSKNTSKNKVRNQSVYDEDTHCGGLKTWAKPDQQYFSVDPRKGAIIEGKEGTLVIVPTDAFVTDEGVLVEETVKFELVEALEMSEMVAYNLVTMADGKPLSSGGMIYVQPSVNGENVYINPKRPLYIEIPTNTYNQYMKSWEGKIDSLGGINWKNPKPLKKYLAKIDFDNLDFLPKGFAQAVANGMPFKSYNVATDFLVDSLYYNMQLIETNLVSDSLFDVKEYPLFKKIEKNVRALFFAFNDVLKSVVGKKYLNGSSVIEGTVIDESGSVARGATISILQNGYSNKKVIKTNNNGVFYFDKAELGVVMVNATLRRRAGFVIDSLATTMNAKDDTIKLNIVVKELAPLAGNRTVNNFQERRLEGVFDVPSFSTKSRCYINPQSIKTILSDDFANTFIATKEFEQRLAILHQMPNAQELFDVYVNNLESDLWIADEKVAALLRGADKAYFTAFAKEKLTNVENNGIYQKQLSAYYNKKKKENIAITKALQEEYAQKSTAELKKEQSKLNAIIDEYNMLSADDNISSSSFSSSSKNKTYVDKTRKIRPKKQSKTSKVAFSKSIITSKSTYATPWFQTGWMNIDSYLHTLGSNPKTVSINGGLDVDDKKGKVRTRLYQCLNNLKVVIPLVVIENVAKAKFPNKKSKGAKSMQNTYCIGLRNQGGTLEIAYRNYSPYQSDKILLTWQKIEQNELLSQLKALPGFNSGLIDIVKKENKALKEAIALAQKRKEIAVKRAVLQKDIDSQTEKVKKLQKILDAENYFIKTLQKIVDKCGVLQGVVLENNTKNLTAEPQVVFNVLGTEINELNTPMFVGGEKAMYDFISSKIIYPEKAKEEGIGGTIYVQFDIAITGEVINVKVVKGASKLLDKEAVRVVKIMPDWIPAEESGQKVHKDYDYLNSI